MIWLIGYKGMLGSMVEKLLISHKYNFIKSDKEIDITNYDVLKQYVNDKEIDWIINCSAYTAVDQAEDEIELAFKINSIGVLNITKIAKEKKAVIIHISTDYVFDGTKNKPYQENDKTNPVGIYGKSKLAGELNIINNYNNYFIIRTSWLFGENGKNFVSSMIQYMNIKNELNIVNDQKGCPTYTKDLAELILKIVLDKSDKYGIYHFSNENITTWYQFTLKIKEIAEKFGLLTKPVKINPISTNKYPTKAKRPKYSIFLKKKVKTTFNVKIRDWEQALEEYISKIKTGISS